MAGTKHRRIRWIALASVAALVLVVMLVWHRISRQHLEPWQFLAHVAQLEHAADAGSFPRQSLGWSLAILGRDDEVRTIDYFPQFDRPPATLDVGQLELRTVPWREAVQEIATRHRLVMIMEDHAASKHREFIGATIPVFKEAGFTHYAAEAIGRFDTSLAERGYPTSRTGLYTSDPQFGNALRRALESRLTVIGYDFTFSTHERREEFAATKLAGLFQEASEIRLLVHAGHSHVLKYETEYGGRWLAARLWDKTGIEPFTVWQWSSQHAAGDHAEIVRVLKERGVSFDEPVLLMPPPPFDCGLQDPPYGLARVDAIVLHPPDESVAPGQRTVLFPSDMQRLAGVWTGGVWPVVVCVYKEGEPIDAVALDQVMLRQDETRFVLWIPAEAEFEIRVFNRHGLLKSRIDFEDDSILVRLENRS